MTEQDGYAALARLAGIDARMVLDGHWGPMSVEDLDEYSTTDHGFPISGDHLTLEKVERRRRLIRNAAVKQVADSFRLVDRT